MREVILGATGQYKLREDGSFYKKKFEHNPSGEVVKEGWVEVKRSFGACDYRGGGYYSVSASLYGDSKGARGHRLHRLVAKHFVKGYKKQLSVNHIDGNRSNNCAANLEWVTHGENIKNAVDRGAFNGRNAFGGKLSEECVLTIITMINAGKTNVEIAMLYGIDKSNISKIRNKDSATYSSLHHLVQNPLQKKYYTKRDHAPQPRDNKGKFAEMIGQ